MTENKEPRSGTNNSGTNSSGTSSSEISGSDFERSRLAQSKRSAELQDRQLLFDVDDKIRDLQKNIDKLQRSRAKEIAAVDKPDATHSSVYRQQSEIRTRYDTVIASELDSISQLRKKRQTLIHKIM